MGVGEEESDERDLRVADSLPADVLARLATIVLAEETLDSVLSKVVELAKQVITPADEVSLTLVRRGRAETAAYTGVLAMQADERQYGLDNGPCLDAGRGGEIFYIRDMRTEDRWPAYAPQAANIGVLSSLSVPLPIQEDLIGALNVYSRRPEAFDEDDIVGLVIVDLLWLDGQWLPFTRTAASVRTSRHALRPGVRQCRPPCGPSSPCPWSSCACSSWSPSCAPSATGAFPAGEPQPANTSDAENNNRNRIMNSSPHFFSV